MVKRLLIFSLLLFSCTGHRKEETESEIGQTPEPVSEKVEPTETKGTTEEEISFKLVDLLEGQLQLELPSELVPMDAEMFRLKYPMENAEATKAYSNGDGTVSMLISPRQDKATQADLPKYQQMLFESFGKNPGIDFEKSEIRKINGRDFIVLQMTTPAADTRVYNQMFVTSSGGRLLMGTFNCTVDKEKEWRPIAEQIIGSVRAKD